MSNDTDKDVTTAYPYEVQQVIATFGDARKFEDAVDAVEALGISRAQISLLASHDAVHEKFGNRLVRTDDPLDDAAIPQPIFTDHGSVKAEKVFAVGLPAYIGGAGAGLAVVATGGALGLAAVIAAVGAAAGAGIGSLLAKAVDQHHAHYLEQQLAMGKLLLTVEVEVGFAREDAIKDVLQRGGAEDVRTVKVTRYWDPSQYAYLNLSPFSSGGLGLL